MPIEADVRISMDGRGRWMDNVFIERVWRSLKYEDVYLKGYADGREAKAGISDWIIFYNERRLHQALGYRAPMAVWRDGAPPGGLWTCGQRKRVDHMSIGGSETAADRTLGGLIKDNQQTHFQLRRRQKRSRCAGPLHNFARRLKTLRGLTPYEFICKAWTSGPSRFKISPLQQTPGLNNR